MSALVLSEDGRGDTYVEKRSLYTKKEKGRKDVNSVGGWGGKEELGSKSNGFQLRIISRRRTLVMLPLSRQGHPTSE